MLAICGGFEKSKSSENLKMVSYFYILEYFKLFCFLPPHLPLMDVWFINQF